MGGYSSGRYRVRNRAAIDGLIRLDIRVMRRRGFLQPGAIVSGSLSWNRAGTGEHTGSVSVSVNLADPQNGFLDINFRLDGDPRSQRVALATCPMRFGGSRYYFLCPRRSARCEVLPMLGGVFASRQAHRVTYQSQSNDQMSRLREKSWKLEKRLWPEGDRPRPRGANRARLLDTWERADTAFESLFASEIRRRWGHLL